MLKTAKAKFFLFTKPVWSWVLLRNPERLKVYHEEMKHVTSSGMVTEFNIFHKLIFDRFFRRVQYLDSDIAKLKRLTGPTVYVMKNRGQLEYRYFNHLFLKEKISLLSYANHVRTVYWWPVKKIWKYFICWLDDLYQNGVDPTKTVLKEEIAKHHNCLLNLSISRDYLFGLMRTNPMDTVMPLVEAQQAANQKLNVVTLQFLYDKHPEKSEKSYFDLLFGEKSQPGAIRKFLLFIMNYRRKPNVKLGEPLELKTFLAEHSGKTVADLTHELLEVIEQNLKIEHARITGPALRSKDAVLKDILQHPKTMDLVHELAKSEGKKPEQVKKEMQKYLKEIAADVNYSHVQFAHVTLNYVWNNIYDGVVIKHDQINRVREAAGKNPIVLVPMHRSHIDYLLISDIFFGQNITFPFVCAGINMNFWPIGGFVRKCGGFFIRRRFEGNKLYKEALYLYVQYLVRHGYCLEFFIEGTRSRTGKMLKPKMGMLSLLLRAYLEGACDDISFVPTSVVYDNLIEEKVYDREKSGQEKDKESARQLLKIKNIFKKKYGKVYIDFAEPISLKEYLAQLDHKMVGVDENRQDVKTLAYELTYHMNKSAIVTPMAMMALTILSVSKHTYKVQDLLTKIGYLKDYLDHKDVNYSDLISFSETYAYNETFNLLQARGILKPVETFEDRFFTIDKKHRHKLDYYKNNIVHFFASLSCFLKTLIMQSSDVVALKDVIKRFESLRQLLEEDFTFSSRAPLREHLLKIINYCQIKGMVSYDESSDMISFTPSSANIDEIQFMQGLFDNYLESHLICLRYVKMNPVQQAEQSKIIKEILEKGKLLYLSDEFRFPEALSKFNLENSFKTLENLGVVSSAKQDGQTVLSVTEDEELIEKWVETVSDLLKGFSGVIVNQSPEVKKVLPQSQQDFH